MSTDELAEGFKCKCGKSVGYDSDCCACGEFADYPHIRFAKAMRPHLLEHFETASARASARGVEKEFAQLRVLLEKSVATLNLKVRVASNLACGQAYRNYYAAVDEKERQLAKRDFHKDREMVDIAVHSAYKHKIVNIALSPDGRGLPNYGHVTLVLRDESIGDRSAVLRENAFTFFTRFALGSLGGAGEEPGWRSDWTDRAMLGAAALEPDLVAGMSDDQLRKLILCSGTSRFDDRYIEVHLYEALVREYVSRFYLAKKLESEDEEICWTQVKEKFAKQPISLMEFPDV